MNSLVNPKEIAIVIVTFHPEWRLIEENFTDIARQIGMVYISDNTPGANSPPPKFNLGDNIVYIPMQDNMGIASAQNAAHKLAISNGYKYLLYFDQDSSPAASLITDYIELVDSSNKQHLLNVKHIVVGPNFYDPRLQLKATNNSNKEQPIHTTKLAGRLMPFLISSGMLISADCLAESGDFREDFFIDCVDIEWCYRAAEKGTIFIQSNRSWMSHTIGDKHLNLLTFRLTLHSPIRHYYFFRNLYYMLRLSHVPTTFKIKAIIKSSLQAIAFSLFAPKGMQHARLILTGILHGLTGKLGKYEP